MQYSPKVVEQLSMAFFCLKPNELFAQGVVMNDGVEVRKSNCKRGCRSIDFDAQNRLPKFLDVENAKRLFLTAYSPSG